MQIRNSIARVVAVASLSFIHGVQAAQSAAPVRFAAPDVASSLPSSSATGIGQVTVALMLVLAAVFAVALLAKKLRSATGSGANGIEVLAQASLGSKERAVIVRVGSERLLLGVASGQVSLLQVLSPETDLVATPASSIAGERPSFASLLKKSLGR